MTTWHKKAARLSDVELVARVAELDAAVDRALTPRLRESYAEERDVCRAELSRRTPKGRAT